jgi:toluene monooxygenase system ferredoxin subunit
MPSRRVAALAELWDGELRGCVVEGHRLVLVKLGGEVHAYDDRCPHLGMPLSDGELEGGVLTCSAHRFEFDARTGAGVNPRSARLCPRRVVVEHGEVFVELDMEAPR